MTYELTGDVPAAIAEIRDRGERWIEPEIVALMEAVYAHLYSHMEPDVPKAPFVIDLPLRSTNTDMALALDALARKVLDD